MIPTFTVVHECLIEDLEPFEGVEKVLELLNHRPNFKLKADNPDDEVHGFVTISHRNPPQLSRIVVGIYTDDVEPDDASSGLPIQQRRKSKLRRPANIPNEQQIKALLGAHISPASTHGNPNPNQ